MFLFFWTLAAIFDFFMVSRRRGRYLKTFPDPVASLSFNMGPWRAMVTTFVPETTIFWCSWQPWHVLSWETRHVLSWETRHVLSWETRHVLS